MVGALEFRRILPHHRLPLRLRDLVFSHPEVLSGDWHHVRDEPLHGVARATPARDEPDGEREERKKKEEGEAFHGLKGLKGLKRLKGLKEFKVERVKGKVAERGGV